ncbi:ABC transporter permease [Bacillus massiliigorillae]|uniref:ABC transporter permease n=1 Tax=Bacillus massiliigorillae TaxID=1243664 RepID=UPI00039F588B|nr:ABC transporter permease [Bacillus massiliigorillae]
MLQNNNSKIIKRISNRSLRANPMRNVFVILSILLTTVLLTSTLVAGFTFYKSNKLYDIVKYTGVDAEGFISATKEQYEKLKDQKDIEEIGFSQNASNDSLKNKEFLGENVSLLAIDDQKLFDMMAIVPMKGNYPKSDKEVFVPTWVLDRLGVDKKVGEKIQLDIPINNQVKKITFTVSGFYESVQSEGSNMGKVIVSPSFVKNYNPAMLKQKNSGTAFVKMDSINEKSSLKEVKASLAQIAKKIGSDSYEAHPSFEKDGIKVVSDQTGQIIAVVAGIVLIIFSGYLIIYNIFYISIVRDIKFYGLMKTIGATSKQIKKMIIRQSLLLSLIGIPLGLIIGYFTGAKLSEMAFGKMMIGNMLIIERSPYIFIIATLFSLLTVLISCRKPGKIAGKVSPIEAVKYVSKDVTYKKKNKKGVNGGKLHKMAWSNIMKNKKRVALSLLSISLSSTIFVFSINIFTGIDPELHADRQMASDIEVNNKYSSMTDKAYKPISADLYNELKSLDFVKHIEPYYEPMSFYKADPSKGTFAAELVNKGLIDKELKGKGTANYYGFETTEEGHYLVSMRSMKASRIKEETSRMRLVDGKLDEEQFKKGNSIIYYDDGSNSVIKAGDKLPLEIVVRDQKGNEQIIKKEFEVMAVVSDKANDSENDYMANNLRKITIEEEAFKQIFPQYESYIQKIGIELKEGTDIVAADERVRQVLVDYNNSQVDFRSKNYFIEGVTEVKGTFTLLGVVIAGIFGIIGALNVINTVLTGLITRKLELATLEAIGMTKKQIRKMIIFEGVYYILLSLVLVLPLGALAAWVAPKMLPIYGGFNWVGYGIAIAIAVTVIAILMLVTPVLGYKSISKNSIIDRMREVE